MIFFNTEDKKGGASFFPSKHIFTYFYFVTSNFFFSYYIKKELFSSVCKWVKGVVWIMWKHILHDSFFFFSLFFRKIILWLRFERRLKCKYLLSEYLYVLFFFFFLSNPYKTAIEKRVIVERYLKIHFMRTDYDTRHAFPEKNKAKSLNCSLFTEHAFL